MCTNRTPNRNCQQQELNQFNSIERFMATTLFGDVSSTIAISGSRCGCVSEYPNAFSTDRHPFTPGRPNLIKSEYGAKFSPQVLDRSACQVVFASAAYQQAQSEPYVAPPLSYLSDESSICRQRKPTSVSSASPR